MGALSLAIENHPIAEFTVPNALSKPESKRMRSIPIWVYWSWIAEKSVRPFKLLKEASLTARTR